MNGNDFKNNTNTMLIFKKYIPFMTVYCLVVSSLYLYGYWSTFGINAFEYASAGDILMLASVGLVQGIIPFLIGAILGTLQNLDPTPEKDTIKDRLIQKMIPYIHKYMYYFKFVYIAILIFLIFFSSSPYKWPMFTLLLGIPFSYILEGQRIFIEIINKSVRWGIFFVIISAPFMAIWFGINSANSVILGKKYLNAEFINITNNILKNSTVALRYIGKIGENIFLYDKNDKSIIVSTMSDIGALRLYKPQK